MHDVETVVPRHTSPAANLLQALRPLQWTKNAVLFAALVFAGRLTDSQAVVTAIWAFVAFCLASSAVYLINDVRDIEADRAHPKKRHRPIASGGLAPSTAVILAVFLAVAALALSWWIRPAFAGMTLAYLALMLAYSFGLKHVVMLDVVIIAVGFVIRAAAGAVAIDVVISPWLLACTLLLALFLGFGKRRHELAHLDAAAAHRPNLESYSLQLLDQLLVATGTATVVAYLLYTIETRGKFGTDALMLTVPFVAFAVFRYLFLLQRKGEGGRPESLLFSDRPLLFAIIGWGLCCVAILYVL